MNLIEKRADDAAALQLDPTPAEDVETLSQRLFGKVVQLKAQVCKGPCVSDDVLNGAFAEEATSPPVKAAEGRR
jgi:hypothetical protein